MRRARAGFEHAARCTKGMPRRRPGDANGNAAQTGGLARQVRQRMNRLGKPEHRARFCFFSKKKSLAGMRRFPITLEIQIPMGFNCGTLNPCSPKNPSPITALRRRLRHRARRNHRRITPAILARRMAFAPPHPPELSLHNALTCWHASRRFAPPHPENYAGYGLAVQAGKPCPARPFARTAHEAVPTCRFEARAPAGFAMQK